MADHLQLLSSLELIQLYFFVQIFFSRKYIFKVQLLCKVGNSGRLFVNYHFLESGKTQLQVGTKRQSLMSFFTTSRGHKAYFAFIWYVFDLQYISMIHLTTIGGPRYFDRAVVFQRLINQSFYQEILLLQKFNDLLGTLFKDNSLCQFFFPHSHIMGTI